MVAGGYPDHDGGFMSAGFLRGPPLTCSPNFVAQGEPNELTLCATT